MPKPFKVLGLAVLFFAAHCMQRASSAAQGAGTAGDVDEAVKELRLDDLEASLRTMAAGPDRDYFSGVLANRTGHIAESIRLLNAALPIIRASRPDRAAVALETLSDDYSKSFQYADAARADDDVLAHFSSQLKLVELKGTKDDAALTKILSQSPPQTIVWDGSTKFTKLKTERNPLSSVNADLTVNGVQGPWLLDTGANVSVVSKSFAKRLGLKLLPGLAQVQAGVTGIENPLRVALLPILQMGSATLHNVVLLVLDDANLNVNLGKQTYQINAIVGYPVFQAFGMITFLHDGEFEAGGNVQPSGKGARMFMKGLSPVVECNVEGKNLPFTFDTGASDTDLFVRYYYRFRSESKTWKKSKDKTAGAGGMVKRKIYIEPQINLGIGDKTVTLRNVSIYTSGTGTDTDYLYGNLGQDVVANFDSFTLDFTTMTFSLGEPLSSDEAR
jgi:predicted aspartyl protease